ncbi:MAG: N-acetylmuramoyl-L-alanine amidase, partial [Actinobacteria bacterium]|nr:N-acetylmuramoyl-L-alanine amidase [Actinomycetota bacterium]
APAPTPTAPPTTPVPAKPVPAAGPAPKALVTSTGVVVPVLGRQGEGLLVGTPCGATAVLSQGTPIDGTVVLDAGHGGVEPGAVGPNGLSEATLNLAVTGFARQALEAAGVPVVLTRTGEYRITLEARAKIVNTLKPKAFVSIHHNAEPDGPRDGPGSETYYQTVGASAAESKRLSGLIYEEIVAALSQYKIAWVADTDAGAKYRKSASGDDYYGIIRRTQGTPASLAELAFLSNPPEAELLAKPEVQKVEGEAVARALVRFLRTKDPGSGYTEPYPRETPAGGGGGASNCRDPALG